MLILFFLNIIFKSVKGQFAQIFYFFIDNYLIQVFSTVMSNLEISKIVIGTWGIGDTFWGEQSHSNSLKTLHSANREGFTWYDTAPVYGKGKSEQLLGQQFRDTKTHIVTKCFTKSVPQVEKSLNQSLKRLNREYIDLFFIHWPSSTQPFEPVLSFLEKKREEGIIKHIGVSNFNKIQLTNALNYGNIDIVQNGFNLFWTKDTGYFNFCKSKGIKTQAYSPLCQGLLTGKYNSKTPYNFDDMRIKTPFFQKELLNKLYPYIEKLNEISQKSAIKLSMLSILWALEYVDSVVVGCRKRNHVEDLLNYKNENLNNEIKDEMDIISKEVNSLIPDYKNIFNHIY